MENKFNYPNTAISPDKSEKKLGRIVETGISLLGLKYKDILGENNLDNLPKNRPVIFATPHFSDTEILITVDSLLNKLKYKKPIKIIQDETHTKFKSNPSGWTSMIIGGKENFLSIGTFFLVDKEQSSPIVETLKNGTSIVMAAYFNPKKEFYNKKFSQKGVILPEIGGVGSIFLAQKTDAVVVPVGVDINDKRKVTVSFGEFLDFKKIENLDDYRKDLKTTLLINNELKKQSDYLMGSLAKLVPEEKQGIWKNKI